MCVGVCVCLGVCVCACEGEERKDGDVGRVRLSHNLRGT